MGLDYIQFILDYPTDKSNRKIVPKLMVVIYMESTIHLLGDEKATLLIPKGVVKETESGVRYLVIKEEKL